MNRKPKSMVASVKVVDNDMVIDEQNMPVFVTTQSPVLPGIPVPLELDIPNNIAIADKVADSRQMIIAMPKKDPSNKSMAVGNLSNFGVYCRPIRAFDMPDGKRTLLVLGVARAQINVINGRRPFITAETEENDFEPINPVNPEHSIALEMINELYSAITQHLPDDEQTELNFNLHQYDDEPNVKINFMIMNSPLEYEARLQTLQIRSALDRLKYIIGEFSKELQKLSIRREIREKAHEELTRQQRDAFLMENLKVLQSELGSNDDNDLGELHQRLEKNSDWPEPLVKYFKKELKKLERYNPNSPDYSNQYTYLDTFLNLPWTKSDATDIDISKVRAQLDSDHYGLNKVKERILEHMAVLKLRGDMKAPILCLYGPPGVGKTSLGKSIATAIGRKYARISLGGLHDEAEIRGHRKTYIGAMSGRIISALEKVGVNNPVFVLDEIDKIGKDYKGDPSQALLEVLDPEQNSKFHDNYIDYDFDLSKIMFIATANDLSGISAPLRDRMEILEIPGYAVEEKLEIAKRHIVSKVLEDLGLKDYKITFTDDALLKIINNYTHESGVRQLEKKISAILRKVAVKIVAEQPAPEVITAEDVVDMLGKIIVDPAIYENNDIPGVVTGLAWTAAGGEILFIETSINKGKGEKLTLTGNLGDVMKESATIALQWLRANGEDFGVTPEMLSSNDVHIHVPEGAVPKDGPSAGITMVTSLTSAFTGKKVKPNLAMTGEISLRGKVLPVGGIKEKMLAAKRAGIKDVILSVSNKKDIEDIEPQYLEGMNFHYVEFISEVLQHALIND